MRLLHCELRWVAAENKVFRFNNPVFEEVFTQSYVFLGTDRNRALFLATKELGLSKWDGSTFTPIASFPRSHIGKTATAITADRNNILWIAYEADGLLTYNDARDEWTEYSSYNSGLNDNRIHDVAVDHGNVKWIVTDSGVTSYNDNHPIVVNEAVAIPKLIKLEPSYPNPFNPSTTIAFPLPAREEVAVEVFNLSGQKVATLAEGYLDAGRHSLVWDAASCSAGMYLCRVKAVATMKTIKMTLVK